MHLLTFLELKKPGMLMRGAVLVSAAYDGRAAWAGRVAGRTGGVANVTLLAEAGGRLRLLSPWPAAPTAAVAVADAATGAHVAVTWTALPGPNGGPLASFDASKGGAYVVTCAHKGTPCSQAPA